MDSPWLAIAGVAIVVITLVDLVWTTLAVTSGQGPFTATVSRLIWTRAAAPRSSHATIRRIGYGLLIASIFLWVGGVWAGLYVLFNADSRAVVDAATQDPAGAVARLSYAAGAMAGAGAGFTAGTGGWQLANNVAALIGLAVFTLVITYLFQVVSATSHKNATAQRIAGLGRDPVAILTAGDEAGLQSVSSQLSSLVPDLALVARRHLSLPVLRYLHVAEPQAAIELNVARLDEALNVVEHGLSQGLGAVMEPMRLAVSEYLRTAPTSGSPEPPSAPGLQPLVDRGIEAVDQVEFERRLDGAVERRTQLRSLIEDNAWSWERDVLGRDSRPADQLGTRSKRLG